MKHSRLAELFSALSKAERRELGKYVHSPVFNRRQDVIDLYEHLYRNFPFGKEEVLRRDLVFGVLFPGEKYDPAKMDHVMSFLFSVLKRYLIQKEQQADPVAGQVLLARSLRRRNLRRLFEREMKLAEKMLEKQPFRDAEYHFGRYQLHLEKHTFAKQKSRTATDSFEEFSSELTAYFLAKKLWENCSLETQRTLSKVDIRQGKMMEAVLLAAAQPPFAEVPAVKLYFHCYMALTEADSLPWFESLRRLIRSNFPSLPPERIKDLYLVAINFCIRRFNTGEPAFIREAFQLYQEGLDLGVFLENGLLSRFTYNNVVVAGLVLKEFMWVENFIHGYKKHLEPKYREGIFKYNLAHFYFQKPDHERAMELLQEAEFQDVMHNVIARRMMLQIFMEKNEREVLSSWLVSFKNYIYRHRELGSYQKDRYLNLIKFTRRLLAIDHADQGAIALLLKEIEETEPVAEKRWLLERLAA